MQKWLKWVKLPHFSIFRGHFSIFCTMQKTIKRGLQPPSGSKEGAKVGAKVQKWVQKWESGGHFPTFAHAKDAKVAKVGGLLHLLRVQKTLKCTRKTVKDCQSGGLFHFSHFCTQWTVQKWLKLVKLPLFSIFRLHFSIFCTMQKTKSGGVFSSFATCKSG